MKLLERTVDTVLPLQSNILRHGIVANFYFKDFVLVC